MSSQDGLGGETVAVAPSRPRKRSTVTTSPTASQNGQNQAFFFVDPASSTREKRAHVMRHHIQAKRKQTMLATQTDRQSRREPRVFPWMKKSNGNEEKPIRNAGSMRTSPQAARHTSPKSSPESDRSYPDTRTATPTSQDVSTSTPSYDASVPWAEDKLIELWTTRLTYWSGQNEHLKQKIFEAAIRHRITFEAVVLGYCARMGYHLNQSPDDSMIRHYESRVRQVIINKTDGDGVRLDDDTISLALTGLALQEDRFGDKAKAREYARQAKDLQVHRNSPSTDPFGRPFLLYLLTTLEPPESAVEPDEAIKLVAFLRTARQCMDHDASHDYLTDVPERSTTFQFDSPLFQLLSSGPRPSQVPADCRVFVVNKNVPTMEWARTAGLVYIMLSLCDLCGDKSRVARFLEYLQRLVLEYGLDRNPACESFLYFMLEETYSADLREPDRAWRANEILEIHKRLPFELQFRFNEMLLGYVMLNPPITSVEEFERNLRANLH